MDSERKEAFSRTAMLLGDAAMERLERARVAVFGIGGVGGYAVEALARSGIGALGLIDSDTVSVSNLNRQILATRDTVGMPKVEAAARRIASIHPECRVTVSRTFVLPETVGEFSMKDYDYVIDAIDTVSGKLAIIQAAMEAGTPVISAMGAGNKLDPAAFRVADIYDTSGCPLCRVMRRELKKRGINRLDVVYSPEQPVEQAPVPTGTKPIPGSNAFVPPAAGLLLAATVVKRLAGIE